MNLNLFDNLIIDENISINDIENYNIKLNNKFNIYKSKPKKYGKLKYNILTFKNSVKIDNIEFLLQFCFINDRIHYIKLYPNIKGNEKDKFNTCVNFVRNHYFNGNKNKFKIIKFSNNTLYADDILSEKIKIHSEISYNKGGFITIKFM